MWSHDLEECFTETICFAPPLFNDAKNLLRYFGRENSFESIEERVINEFDVLIFLLCLKKLLFEWLNLGLQVSVLFEEVASGGLLLADELLVLVVVDVLGHYNVDDGFYY